MRDCQGEAEATLLAHRQRTVLCLPLLGQAEAVYEVHTHGLVVVGAEEAHCFGRRHAGGQRRGLQLDPDQFVQFARLAARIDSKDLEVSLVGPAQSLQAL